MASFPSLGCRCSLLLVALVLVNRDVITSHGFEIKEATIDDIQLAFQRHELTSRQLVEYYLEQIRALNPLLRAVIEVNPDALVEADLADGEQRRRSSGGARRRHIGGGGGLHGIPVLIKDNIATGWDRLMNTTAGSLALVGAVAPRDSGVVARLRRAGAVILGKASMSEWAAFRSISAPSGWNARAGQGKNPYVLSADPCGSSSGSAIAVAANMVAVALGTETDGSIICPSNANATVGIKPTVGLTSRAGVIPISPRQDTIGPICRSVSDAVHVLDAIVGYDPRDAEATATAAKMMPRGGYRQFLRADGLKGKRLGILRSPFFDFPKDSVISRTYEKHFRTLRHRGAILVDNLEVANTSVILNATLSGEIFVLLAEFKVYLNKYLSELRHSPVRSLEEVIDFNNKHRTEEKIDEYGQDIFLAAQVTNGIGPTEKGLIENMARLSMDGLERLMREKKLDAVVTPGAYASRLFAIGGYPGISIPAGYLSDDTPFGICFGGLKGSEPKLIEIAYAFEQATKIRKLPSFKP